MMRWPATARLAAMLVALVALSGLWIQFTVSLAKTGSPQAALWTMAGFFTIIGNSIAALLFLAVALRGASAARPGALGGITLITGLIGVVYTLMLRRTEHLVGAGQLANALLHYVMPLLVAAYWLAFAPKGELNRMHPLVWMIIPLAYFPYALVRATSDGRYAYPFIDVTSLGWPHVIVNALVIAVAYLLAGLLLVWLDRMMAPRPPSA